MARSKSKSTAKQQAPQVGSSRGHTRSEPVKSASAVHSKMSAYGQQLANNPTAARKFLESAGIITAKGNLRKVFGG
jgi:hypothetical protein